MARKSCTVKVSPDIMKWAVGTSGLEIPDIAKRLRVSESAVNGWMQGTREISLARLESLAKYIKRPLAVFLLDKPPDRKMPPDYRRLSQSNGKVTHKTALAIRLAGYLQEAAGEMMRRREQDAAPDVRPGVTVRHSPKNTASQERRRLDLDGGQGSSKHADRTQRLYENLRDSIESMNILVFQQSANLDEMRGLSLSDDSPSVILINSKDSPAARRFTLMHEYGHILLRKGDLCMLNMHDDGEPSRRNVESWCDRFAASALMPENEFREEYEKLNKGAARGEIIDLLSGKFATSRLATATHARELGLVAQDAVDTARQYADAPRTGGRTPTPPTKCLNERGRKFVSLVLASRHDKEISSRDAADYLDMDLAHTAALQEQLF